MSTQPLVLVADDEPRITKLVSIALGGEGFRVITAQDGEEALRKAEEVRPDVILLDIVMPDLDGIEVELTFERAAPTTLRVHPARRAVSSGDQQVDDRLEARARRLIHATTTPPPPRPR